ncbi:hypothetical protein Desor_1214 [Desulfosporosinus orientis DSM 765]|uniref:Uncharacterized protein n=1 Tax=Desulfosporosinus orientis (strain ATCC 19365 / DSM 765 / NCIMB 8382 / VKM B-1628 / Singapore I) TaxID=768706 RepID=G7WCX5_DESOD|nr:hypothetical protein [Desulfosporosinus orientis]AET66881.1 hypothetical protein Desor_1214 [Desulfosporosinus orientis DSM 765]
MKLSNRWGESGKKILIVWFITWILGFVPMAVPTGTFPNKFPVILLWFACTTLVSFICVMILCLRKANIAAEDM